MTGHCTISCNLPSSLITASLGKKYFDCKKNCGIFVRPEQVQPFSEEEKAASTLQSLVRMRAGKKKAKAELNWRTWNALDNRNEQLQLERGKKVRAELGNPLVPAGKKKRRISIKEAGREALAWYLDGRQPCNSSSTYCLHALDSQVCF